MKHLSRRWKCLLRGYCVISYASAARGTFRCRTCGKQTPEAREKVAK